jgi:hypothetical protein
VNEKVEEGAEEGNGRPKNRVSNVFRVIRRVVNVMESEAFGMYIVDKSQLLRDQGQNIAGKKEGSQCRVLRRVGCSFSIPPSSAIATTATSAPT